MTGNRPELAFCQRRANVSFDAARGKSGEENGLAPPSDPDAYRDLGTIKQSSSKRVAAWAAEADVNPAALDSNSFEMEWPPNSGAEQAFPEFDRAAYFPLDAAAEKIVDGQRSFLDRHREAVPEGD